MITQSTKTSLYKGVRIPEANKRFSLGIDSLLLGYLEVQATTTSRSWRLVGFLLEVISSEYAASKRASFGWCRRRGRHPQEATRRCWDGQSLTSFKVS